jgi:hypothetical protein
MKILWLKTSSYRKTFRQAAAAFSLYGRSEEASRLRRILDEREITARILSL